MHFDGSSCAAALVDDVGAAGDSVAAADAAPALGDGAGDADDDVRGSEGRDDSGGGAEYLWQCEKHRVNIAAQILTMRNRIQRGRPAACKPT
jgi:hypothetical protein